MTTLSVSQMRGFLSKSVNTRTNRNKINGLLAEVDLRREFDRLGFADRVSVGGWIFRNVGKGGFATQNVVAFPASIAPGSRIAQSIDNLGDPAPGLSAIGSHFHSAGISAYACAATLLTDADPNAVTWHGKLLGTPKDHSWIPFPGGLSGFDARERRYNFLQFRTDASVIPESAVPDEFSKENLRVAIQNALLCEMSDIDGVFFGKHLAYPLEIKEKTSGAPDKKLGEYFGLDGGPFAKLAFYAAKRGGMLHSLFVVREITDVKTRDLKSWWLITFEELALAASWVPRSGGKTMGGGSSSVIMVPKAAFAPLNSSVLSKL